MAIYSAGIGSGLDVHSLVSQLVAADPIEQNRRDHIDRQRYPALFSQRLQIHAYSVISFKYRANAFFHSGSS